MREGSLNRDLTRKTDVVERCQPDTFGMRQGRQTEVHWEIPLYQSVGVSLARGDDV